MTRYLFLIAITLLGLLFLLAVLTCRTRGFPV